MYSLPDRGGRGLTSYEPERKGKRKWGKKRRGSSDLKEVGQLIKKKTAVFPSEVKDHVSEARSLDPCSYL